MIQHMNSRDVMPKMFQGRGGLGGFYEIHIHGGVGGEGWVVVAETWGALPFGRHAVVWLFHLKLLSADNFEGNSHLVNPPHRLQKECSFPTQEFIWSSNCPVSS